MEPAPRAARSSARARGTSLRAQLEGASPAARALLPIRFFFGATFVYAGLDKIVDPSFLDPNSPTSITAQLAAFTRTSPLTFLIKPMEPMAVLIGLLIALAEIAVGLGALSGLLFRLAATCGALLSFMFFLTASWATHPYYYGPDLPYAFGWLALAIGGTGGLLVPRFIADIGAGVESAMPWGQRVAGSAAAAGFRPPYYLDEEPSLSRRLLVQTGVLAGATLVVGALAFPVRVLRYGAVLAAAETAGDGATLAAGSVSGSAGPGAAGVAFASAPPSDMASASALAPDMASASVTASGAPASTSHATPRPTSKPTPGGPTSAPRATPRPAPTLGPLAVATTAQVDQYGAVRIVVPVSAPSSLPAGDPALIVKLTSGGYACYDAICTHQGCRVGWDARDDVILCPCHGAAYDPNNHAAVIQGPANQPLLELPIAIDKRTGIISLRA